jgi:RecB family endonuclease NucS
MKCRCEPHAQASNRCEPCKAEMAYLTPPERPSGTARSPYVRRASAQLRLREIDEALEQQIEIKRKLMKRLREIDAECEQAPTLRGSELELSELIDECERAPSRPLEMNDGI